MTWDPEQYRRFQKEREEPFHDLLELIQVSYRMQILDIGCGDGKITAHLHHSLSPCDTWGIDASPEMIKEASQIKEEGLSFSQLPFEDLPTDKQYDLIFSNACLQWIPNHPKVFAKLARMLTNRGQLAIQIPSNFHYPTHTIAAELAQEKAYQTSTLGLEDYAQLLYDLGFQKQVVRLQVYSHVLPSTESLLEWVKGSLLSYYRSVMMREQYDEFLIVYRERLLRALGKHAPFFFPMKRMLIWAQKEH